jgi:hypothetical protein
LVNQVSGSERTKRDVDRVKYKHIVIHHAKFSRIAEECGASFHYPPCLHRQIR